MLEQYDTDDNIIANMILNLHPSITDNVIQYYQYLDKLDRSKNPDSLTIFRYLERIQDCIKYASTLVTSSYTANIKSTTATSESEPLNQKTAQYIINDLIATRNKYMAMRDYSNVNNINDSITKYFKYLACRCSKNSVKLPKRIIYVDSGANITVLSDKSHAQGPITPIDKCKDITVANGNKVTVTEQSCFLGKTAQLSTAFNNSLLSISQHTAGNRSVAIFWNDKMHIVKNNHIIKPRLQSPEDAARQNDLIELSAKNVNGLYAADIDDLQLKLANHITSSRNVSTYNINEYYSNDDDVLYANTTYYTNIPNVHTDNATDLVRFFHEA